MNIFFDMDGTLADFYGVNGWLDYILTFNPFPYKVASPLIDANDLTDMMYRLQEKGIKICILSWLAKKSTKEYDEAVTAAKIEWLANTFKIKFDAIYILPYGTPKYKYCLTKNDILFDDEQRNRDLWTGNAYTEKDIVKVLKSML